MTNPKIVILYAAYGEGHIQVSKALHSAFLRRGIADVKLINLFAEAHPMLDAMTRYLYVKSCAHTPELYGWSYYLSNRIPQSSKFAQWMHSLGISKLTKVIREERPDAIIHTFPFLAACEIKKNHGLDIPLYTVITDFTLHHRWKHELTDLYFVASEELKQALLATGEKEERIRVSGIPLRDRFVRCLTNPKWPVPPGLDPDKRTVLVMAGKFGMLGAIRGMVDHLAAYPDVQTVLVCGKNEALRKSMEAAYAGYPQVRVVGFVEPIEEFMAVSSLLITKAGGVTLSEAMHLNLPALVYKPLPGQEKENALYLQSKGAALIADSMEEFREQTDRCLREPDGLLRLRQALARMPKRDSGAWIVDEILRDAGVLQPLELVSTNG